MPFHWYLYLFQHKTFNLGRPVWYRFDFYFLFLFGADFVSDFLFKFWLYVGPTCLKGFTQHIHVSWEGFLALTLVCYCWARLHEISIMWPLSATSFTKYVGLKSKVPTSSEDFLILQRTSLTNARTSIRASTPYIKLWPPRDSSARGLLDSCYHVREHHHGLHGPSYHIQSTMVCGFKKPNHYMQGCALRDFIIVCIKPQGLSMPCARCRHGLQACHLTMLSVSSGLHDLCKGIKVFIRGSKSSWASWSSKGLHRLL